jgi:hypothetical protein
MSSELYPLNVATPERVVKTYGRGSFLGFLSPILAAVMASAGMRGWQETALREMEDDAVDMARRGYRVIASEELGYPRLGMTYHKVTYEPGDAVCDLSDVGEAP